ncbi:MAG: citramalate synthase [Alphaproteobacteria bacterium]|nr:citramalate synthase [Alphaproteobacteria bacterium]
MSEYIHLFDTTLRDGAQTLGVDFSYADKVAIAQALDEFGIDYIEGGWPGANPGDTQFFAEPPSFRHAKLVAFGMTRRPGRSVENDPGLASVLDAKAYGACLVGKAWDFHVRDALNTTLEENLAMIESSVAHCARRGFEPHYDAEHFFDGYKSNPDFARQCLRAAFDGGAKWVVLCDTNGGTLPDEVHRIITALARDFDVARMGIHTHNDTENAVANTLTAVRAGVRLVQGTLNGLGERCGNANLISVIPSLMLKMGFSTSVHDLGKLKALSELLSDRLNSEPVAQAAYVGRAAFAHKGGLHGSAVLKDPRTYEHIVPELVGNSREVIMSDQAGRANIISRLTQAGLVVEDAQIPLLLDAMKKRQAQGYSYDGASASFELMVHERLGTRRDFFTVSRFRVIDERRLDRRNEWLTESEATITLQLRGQSVHTVAVGRGPVNALDRALRSALVAQFAQLGDVRLVDYRVRIIHPTLGGIAEGGSGSSAVTRVIIECTDGVETWSTVGVSENIIGASFEALVDAYIWRLVTYAGRSAPAAD